MPIFDEKSKYLECFLRWYHLIQAKPRASRITTVKIPPRKARAAEEPEELVGVTGQLAVLVELSVLEEFALGSAPSSIWVELALGPALTLAPSLV